MKSLLNISVGACSCTLPAKSCGWWEDRPNREAGTPCLERPELQREALVLYLVLLGFASRAWRACTQSTL